MSPKQNSEASIKDRSREGQMLKKGIARSLRTCIVHLRCFTSSAPTLASVEAVRDLKEPVDVYANITFCLEHTAKTVSPT